MLNNIACMDVGDHRGNYQLVDDITEKVKTYSVIGTMCTVEQGGKVIRIEDAN